MARPHFSQTLVERRRDLGLSVEQAASVLKMKVPVLQAFEEGDWERIPRSGYAQGMLSSYARYLGLNPRNVIDEFKQDLLAYSHESGPEIIDEEYQARRTRAGYAERYMGQRFRMGNTDDIDLYGSAGPAGSITSSGTFDDEMLSRMARERSGHRGVGYSERYLESPGHGASGTMARQEAKHHYNRRVPTSSAQRRAPRPRPSQERSRQATRKAQSPTSATIQTRRLESGLYQDDLRYDRARPYEAASSEKGRAASRHISKTTRPNVRRQTRETSGRRHRDSHSRTRTQRRSYAGIDRRVLIVVVLALFVGILLTVVLSVNSCVSNLTNDAKPQVPVTSAPSEVSGETNQGDDGDQTQDEGVTTRSSDEDASSKDASSRAGTTVSKAPSSVTISVADGNVSWVEVTMGDTSLIAQTVSGPWAQTYTPTDTMMIRASDTSAVSVTADGTPLVFEAKAPGVGVIQIEGPTNSDTKDDEDNDAVSRDDESEEGNSAESGW